MEQAPKQLLNMGPELKPKSSSTSANRQPSPATLRGIFGQNLRTLCAGYPSVAGLCRTLGINRTQFNRYLAGESFPRPDVLHLICSFFNVDARILLEPVADLKAAEQDFLNHPMLRGFFDDDTIHVPEVLFPNGFYRFVRRSFIGEAEFVIGLVFVKRKNGYTFMRGYEPRDAIRKHGLSVQSQSREYRGLVMRQEEGVMAIVTHRNALSCSFNFLTPETSLQANLWEGYATRTMREKVTSRRAVRMVYEHLGNDRGVVMNAARNSGMFPHEEIPLFHSRLLQIERDFR